MQDLDVQTIILIVLAATAVWCLAEAALTVRRARKGVDRVVLAVDKAVQTVDELKGGVDGMLADARPLLANVDAAVSEARPVIAHVDEVVTQARPAATDVSPLLQKTAAAVDALSGSLDRVDAILGDVSRLTSATTSATAAVGTATTGILEKVRGRMARRPSSAEVARLVAATSEQGSPQVRPSDDASRVEVGEVPADGVIMSDGGYFTYPDDAAGVVAPRA